MNDVGLHSFLGGCPLSMLETIFPQSDKQQLSEEQMKEVIVFEESEGHEMTITFFFQYLVFLAKYEKGNLHCISKLCIYIYTCIHTPKKGLSPNR